MTQETTLATATAPKKIIEFDSAAGDDLIHELMMLGKYGQTSIVSGVAYLDMFYPEVKNDDDYAPVVDYIQLRLVLTPMPNGEARPASDLAAIKEQAKKLIAAVGFVSKVAIRIASSVAAAAPIAVATPIATSALPVVAKAETA